MSAWRVNGSAATRATRATVLESRRIMVTPKPRIEMNMRRPHRAAGKPELAKPLGQDQTRNAKLSPMRPRITEPLPLLIAPHTLDLRMIPTETHPTRHKTRTTATRARLQNAHATNLHTVCG